MSSGRYQTIGEHYGRLMPDSQLWTEQDLQQTFRLTFIVLDFNIEV